MKYRQEIILKDGRKCIIRNAEEKDARGVLDCFIRTHEESDFLASYPDEITLTLDQEIVFLRNLEQSADEVELLAEVEGKIVGLAGVNRISQHYKVRHRCSFGISIIEAYCHLGIGKEMLKTAIGCAREAAYTQLELEVVSGNEAAAQLYKSFGFKEFGIIPRGFRSRYEGYQDLIVMGLDLDEEKEE